MLAVEVTTLVWHACYPQYDLRRQRLAPAFLHQGDAQLKVQILLNGGGHVQATPAAAPLLPTAALADHGFALHDHLMTQAAPSTARHVRMSGGHMP